MTSNLDIELISLTRAFIVVFSFHNAQLNIFELHYSVYLRGGFVLHNKDMKNKIKFSPHEKVDIYACVI